MKRIRWSVPAVLVVVPTLLALSCQNVEVTDGAMLTETVETRVFVLKHVHPPPVYKFSLQYARTGPPSKIFGLDDDFAILKTLSSILSRNTDGSLIGRLEYDIDTNAIIINDSRKVLDKVSILLAELDVESK